MSYVKFTEENDHEGETWVFWLQATGNLAELAKLEELIADSDMYTLEANVVLDEHDVDILVEHGGGGYLDNHNKVDGKFTCPAAPETVPEWSDVASELFYKGDIRRYFTN